MFMSCLYYREVAYLTKPCKDYDDNKSLNTYYVSESIAATILNINEPHYFRFFSEQMGYICVWWSCLCHVYTIERWLTSQNRVKITMTINP